ncbi:MAG TPA: alpha/beta hydrolase [Solirubrobacteraceae bacterium]|jgi:pimeloyl-ACP methyl ester carboxylesterase|nr:alpha/beta hydrolase [Solirubrobacteraceae bacterium]
MSTQIAGVPDLAEAYAEVNGIRLHYVHAGEGPLVVLLHGFPEFWYSWRHQIPVLAKAGFRVVAPDMRGYNLSERPRDWRRYDADVLAQDIAGLIDHLGEGPAYLVGHDWGAVIAYQTAMRHPELLRKLAILNVPHTERMLAGFRTLRQLRKSWYMFFFQIPRLPEHLLEREDFSFAKRSLRADSPGAFSDVDLERYAQAWAQPGALTGMVNYYRAALRRSPRAALAQLVPIQTQTLVIWGMRDRHLGSELAAPLPQWVPNVRMERLPQATHWVQHDEPERVNELLIEFFGGAGS